MCCMLSFGETSESEQLKKCFGSIGQMQTSGKETQRRADTCPTWRWTKETNRRAMQQNGSMDELEAEGYSAEEIGAIAQEEETARAAWVAMQDARRTLRDARARQHANVTPVLPSETRRQGWRWQPVEADGVGSLWKQMGSSKPGIECFRSGGPHKIADCKEKPKGVEQAKVATAPKRLRLCSGHHRTHRSRAAN